MTPTTTVAEPIFDVKGGSLDVFFDYNTSYKLWSVDSLPTNWVVRNLNQVGDTEQDTKRSYHPISGKNGKIEKAVYRALLQTDHVLGDSPNEAPFQVAIKWVTGMSRIGLLKWEAGFYIGELQLLQGDFVPKFYGFYAGKINGVDVGCLVLEWCGGISNPDIRELNRQKLLAATKIHSVGILHGGLFKDDHHFVPGTEDNILRIIDFSAADHHICPGRVRPMVHRTTETPAKCSDCAELAELEKAFGPDTGDQAVQIRHANGSRELDTYYQ